MLGTPQGHCTALLLHKAACPLTHQCLLLARLPPQGQKKTTIQEILNSEPFLPPYVTEGAAHFIRWALTKDPTRRSAQAHVWALLHAPKHIRIYYSSDLLACTTGWEWSA